MRKIGILSDTHSYLHPKLFEFFRDCNEIWHAGDIGTVELADEISRFKPLKAVYGNIDGTEIRKQFPVAILEKVEDVKILMMHVGGFPGHYPKNIRDFLETKHPDLFICGHSHILKVMYDMRYHFLLINPGAAGKYGLHQSITMVRLTLDGKDIRDLEVLDIPRKNAEVEE
jgi:putative phosphoesterase